MGFTTPCFIRKNTPELRKRLEYLGYNQGTCVDDYDRAIFTDSEREEYNVEFLSNITDDEIAVDCGTNEELFISLSAKRDDTASNQYWVFNCDFPPHYKKGDFTIGYFHRCSCYCHVATVEELIEHFK